MRIALATLRYRRDPDEALRCVQAALESAARQGARLLCTAENYLPGLRGVEFDVAPPDAAFLARAERTLRETAATTGVGAIIGIERVMPVGLVASALVIAPDGQLLGYQDKVQVDPSEEGTYVPGAGRHVFEIDGVRFGVAICHEGWRYPETVRWAARRGAQIVFHPQYSPAADSPRKQTEWATAGGTMHEKAAICRAAENAIYFATVNYAIPGSIAGTALIDPDGTVSAMHGNGEENTVIADIDLSRATGLLARRLAAAEYSEVMHDEIIIRPASAADAPALAATIAAAFGQYRGRLMPESAALNETAASITSELHKGAGAFLAERGGALVGCVMTKPFEGDLYFGRLSVLPTARGEGVGRRLVSAVEAEARRRGSPATRLSVRIALPENHNFFTSMGYSETARKAHSGFTHPTFIHMRKAFET